MTATCSSSTWARNASEAEEPLVGYPVLTTTVDGHPIYAYIPIRRRPYRSACAPILLLSLASVVSFFVWPRTLEITVTDITLRNIHFNVKKGDSLIPQVFLDLSLDVRLRARNPNFFGVTYENVTVSILFEGDEIAQVESYGAKLDALSTSYADATLELHSYCIASNVLKLLADVANKALPLQTITMCRGNINLYILKLPLEGKVTCNLVVNPQDQLIISQDCL
ncbi:hypothetical protein GOP47_0002367 [Adiantum capillus-veneris]|uniref:Late embryogenesis abundant protein LEA-2 subgroup domain-containing protein n=1 Tax=Adiantum capillus-veneris TaxID=13818 RepID=A0A9D4VAT1_ADICA|nr:hypothetical protein GOP47_0002367 [Adiantum capillus-veneris]